MLNKLIILLAILFLNWSATKVLAQHNHDHTDKKEIKENAQKDEHNHGEEEIHTDSCKHEDPDMNDEHGDPNEHDDHDDGEVDEDHNDEDGHENHSDELSIELTAEGIQLADIKISKVLHGQISTTLELPGEIGFNEDRLAHISPRFAGIALIAYLKVGDYVKEGDPVAIIESNESMTSYTIKAPISGWVIERHITTGEYVSEENSIYMIADLSTVWVNLSVYPKDANQISKGQMASIRAIGTEEVTTGSIDFISPIMDFRTRTATARIDLQNPGNNWCPGSFIQATISNEDGVERLVIEKNAIQSLDGHSIVFVPDGTNRFRPVEVITGESDAEHIQILDGLSEGSEYVSSGAFELKAKIVTSNLDAHAGHGH